MFRVRQYIFYIFYSLLFVKLFIKIQEVMDRYCSAIIVHIKVRVCVKIPDSLVLC